MEHIVNNLQNVKEVISQVNFLSPFADKIKELEEKFSEKKLNLVFVGEFNSGKSSLINALFNLELPTNVLPETASIWRIKIAPVDKPQIKVNLSDKVEEVSSFEDVKKYDPNLIHYIDVFVNANIDEGFIIIDTPGLSSLNPKHREVLENFIDQADVLLIAVDVNQGITGSLKDFIKSNLKEKRKTYAVITKSDTKPEKAVEELKNYIKNQFRDFVEDVVSTSASKGEVEELKALLQKISQEKESIVIERVETGLKKLCKDMLSIINQQIENAQLDLSDLEVKMKEIRKNIEEVKEAINEKQREAEEKIKKISDEATIIFKNSMKKQVDWIIEKIEDIEDRFNKAIRQAVKEALQFVEGEMKGMLQEVEYLANELGRKHDIGKNISIKILKYLIILDKVLKSSIIIVWMIILRRFFKKNIPREIVIKIIMPFFEKATKKFIEDKIAKAIEDPKFTADFRKALEESLNQFMFDFLKDIIEDLERTKKSYELAYKQLLEEKRKRVEEFTEYINNLREMGRKLELCLGG